MNAAARRPEDPGAIFAEIFVFSSKTARFVAKLILYPDANHGSWYQNHEDFVFEANRFLNG